jgi:cytochrome c-type biogenesis protein
MQWMPRIATLTVLLATVSVPLHYGRHGMLLADGVGHCSVIVAVGTSAEPGQRFLNWNEQSKGVTAVKYVCGVLVILGGLLLIYSAP